MPSESVTISLSAQAVIDIDSLRGRKSRAAYLAALVTAIVAGAAAEAEAEAARQAAGIMPDEPCPHPAARVHKGLCHNCGCSIAK